MVKAIVEEINKSHREQIGKCEDQEKLKLLLRLLIIRFLSGEEDVPNKGTSSFLVPYTINIEFCI